LSGEVFDGFIEELHIAPLAKKKGHPKNPDALIECRTAIPFSLDS